VSELSAAAGCGVVVLFAGVEVSVARGSAGVGAEAVERGVGATPLTLTCVTGPLSPALPIRTLTLMFAVTLAGAVVGAGAWTGGAGWGVVPGVSAAISVVAGVISAPDPLCEAGAGLTAGVSGAALSTDGVGEVTASVGCGAGSTVAADWVAGSGSSPGSDSGIAVTSVDVAAVASAVASATASATAATWGSCV
jgi:hypothetical protein